MAFKARLFIILTAGFFLAPFTSAEARPSTQTVGSVIGAQGLNGKLVTLLNQLARQYNRPVVVSSGCRSTHGNRRAGGAKHSMHLRCMAADIKLSGVSESSLVRAARALPGRGGIGTYCWNSVVHIDVGPKREWHEGGCGRRISKRSVRGRRFASR
jgi:hypothetical protein